MIVKLRLRTFNTNRESLMKVNFYKIFLICYLFAFYKGNAQEHKFSINGFFDLEAEVSNKDASGKIWTFDQHHLNIITNYLIDDHFRVSSEIEWEHGPLFSSSLSTGNIYLAKAFLEYKHSDALLIRAGKFLSPFGIYNEKHDATPTYLSSFLPQSIYGNQEQSFGGKGRLFAKHSTGIQLLGNLYLDNMSLKYHVYLSNGRGPNENEKDNNSNKGVGWRVVFSPMGQELSIGNSFYSDRNGNAGNTLQSTIGFDVEYNSGDAHIEAEYFIPKIEKVDEKGIPNGKYRTVNGYYVLGAYTFLERITPFIRFEQFDSDIDFENNSETITTIGINYSISSSVFLKAETQLYRFQNQLLEKYELFVTSIAVAF